ncbi:MAG: DegT/DnrJ/EryC1/StrS family aminotransferase [Alphaproteobacteria bacterium]
MNHPRIYLSPPHMSGREETYVAEAFASNFIAPLGPMVDRFEAEFSRQTGFAHCLALSSGTAAIHLALRCLGIAAGDRVYASSLTFIGSITPILFQNATPVFIDAAADSWNMDVALVAEKLAEDKKKNQLPKAILPTDLYGQSCDLDALRALADDYGIALVIDAAESVGASYKGRFAGRGAHAACYSFNGNKIITTSGGGMLASDDKALIDEARKLSQQAREPAAHYEHVTYGYNYRLSNISAAIGVGQLEVLAERVTRRRAIYDYYRTHLGALPGLRFVPEMAYGQSNRWLSVMLVDANKFGTDRETIRLALEKENIESRPVWKPMHLQPVFKGAEIVAGEMSEALFRDGLCLPSGSAMTKTDLDRVVAAIRAIS